MNDERSLFRTAAVADGDGVFAAPGVVLVEGETVLAAGAPEAIGDVCGTARIVDLSHHVIIPGLVNTHCHLDLSHIGPRPFTGDFPSWVGHVRENRAMTPEAVEAATKLGIELAIAGGTAMIGDIAGLAFHEPLRTLRASGMAGVSFLEVFGIAARNQQQAITKMQMAAELFEPVEHGVALGMQPHAPYSCNLDVYSAAVKLNRPLSTHLSETFEEIEFVRSATGPLKDMLDGIGVLDETVIGQGKHPIDHVLPKLAGSNAIAAHVNYLDDAHLESLAAAQVSIAYCPRASAYFGHQNHRYREMLEAGINVTLGTDSLICLDTPDRISVLDEMRLLHQRDAVDPMTLLRMATVNGAKALGFDDSFVKLSQGPVAGLLAVTIDDARQPMESMLRGNAAPQWVHGPFTARNSWWKGRLR